jgi:hypothetical protein
MTESIVEILMRRDGLSKQEAELSVQEARQRVTEGEDPEEVLQDEFGLEPDYIFDLLA